MAAYITQPRRWTSNPTTTGDSPQGTLAVYLESDASGQRELVADPGRLLGSPWTTCGPDGTTLLCTVQLEGFQLAKNEALTVEVPVGGKFVAESWHELPVRPKVEVEREDDTFTPSPELVRVDGAATTVEAPDSLAPEEMATVNIQISARIPMAEGSAGLGKIRRGFIAYTNLDSHSIVFSDVTALELVDAYPDGVTLSRHGVYWSLGSGPEILRATSENLLAKLLTPIKVVGGLAATLLIGLPIEQALIRRRSRSSPVGWCTKLILRLGVLFRR